MTADPHYRALLIGNATFPRDPHALPTIEGPRTDIKELYRALIDDEVGLFSAENIQKPMEDEGIQVLRENLEVFLSTAGREDVILIYYSGHGTLDEQGGLYLCASNTVVDRLCSTALSAREINNMILRSAAATTIIVLDCCHSGAFKVKAGTNLATAVAGRGRYVLTSNRSTELALAASVPGEPSPFTGALVDVLRHGESTGDLTVAELYRQVHRRMTRGKDRVPQLRFAGEGDVVIARRGKPQHLASQLPESPPAGAPWTGPAMHAEEGEGWRAERILTGGVRCLLRVSDGNEEHTVEYRSQHGQKAVVVRDRWHVVYRGPCLFRCEFRLGRFGPLARLEVTDDPDIRLWVEQKQIYQLRDAAPGTNDHVEHRAAAVRTVLLANNAAEFRVAPYIFGRARAVLPKMSRSTQSTDRVIAVGVFKDDHRLVFTEQGITFHTDSEQWMISYEDLGALPVTGSYKAGLSVGDRSLPLDLDSDRAARALNAVKAAVVYQETGLGTAPPVHRFSGVPLSYPWAKVWAEWARCTLVVSVLLGLLVVVESLVLHAGSESYRWQDHAIFAEAGYLVGGFALLLYRIWFWIDKMSYQPGLRLSLTGTAVYTVAASAMITWAPTLWGFLTPDKGYWPQFEWHTQLTDWVGIAIGNTPQTMALGFGPRILGTILVALAAFLPAAAVCLFRHFWTLTDGPWRGKIRGRAPAR